MLRGQDGRFGARGIALKGAIAGAAIAIEYAWERKRPEGRAYRISTVCNFATAATMGAFAYRNTTIPAPK